MRKYLLPAASTTKQFYSFSLSSLFTLNPPPLFHLIFVLYPRFLFLFPTPSLSLFLSLQPALSLSLTLAPSLFLSLSLLRSLSLDPPSSILRSLPLPSEVQCSSVRQQVSFNIIHHSPRSRTILVIKVFLRRHQPLRPDGQIHTQEKKRVII